MTRFGDSENPVPPKARLVNIAHVAAFVVLLIAFVGNFYFFSSYALDAISYPYELNYGEGIVWRQMVALGDGAMYSSIHEYPYFVFHYTPIFHFIAFLVSEAFGDPLAAGRAVSLVAALVYAALIGIVVGQAAGRETPRIARLAGMVSGFLVLFTFWPVYGWSPIMRVDMLALMFDMGGVALFLASLKRPRLFYASALVFVLAVYTKQFVIGGACVCFAISFLVRFALTLRAFGLALVVGGIAMAVLTVITGGEFPLHVFLYNANQIFWGQLSLVSDLIRSSVFVVVLTIVSAILIAMRLNTPRRISNFGAWLAALRGDPQSAARLAVLLYLFVNVVLVFGIVKSGASINYLIPLAGACSILFGLFIVELVPRLSVGTARSGGGWPMAAISVTFLLCIWQVYYGKRWTFIPAPEQVQAAQAVLEKINQLPGPVWSEDMTLALIAGKDVIADPATATELSYQGVWDQEPFLRLIRGRKFDAIITWTWKPQRFTPEMKTAIKSHYPIVQSIGKYKLFYPPAAEQK